MSEMTTDQSASITCYFEERNGEEGLFVSAVELGTGTHLTLWIPRSDGGIDAAARLVENAPSIVHSALLEILEVDDE